MATVGLLAHVVVASTSTANLSTGKSATVFAQDNMEVVYAQWRAVADQLRGKRTAVPALMAGPDDEVLSYN